MNDKIPNEVGAFGGTVTAHECGLRLGLAAPNTVLNGDSGWHNKSPWSFHVMDPGSFAISDLLQKINLLHLENGRKGSVTWRPISEQYLKFILPKEDAQ